MSTEPPRPPAGERPPSAAGPRRGLRTKALLLLALVAGAPLGAAGPTLVELGRSAVVESETRAQGATLGEAAAQTAALVEVMRSDAAAVAAAMAEAASNPRPEGDGLSGVRATLATRRSFDAVRFEVPSASVSTVLRKQGSAGDPPASSEALRASADERGMAFAVSSERATLVVPIASRAGGARGYITAGVDLDAVRGELAQVVLGRFDNRHATLLVVDGQRRVVAAAGSEPLAQGEDAGKLPVLGILPAGVPWTERVAAVRSLKQGNEAVVGGVQTVPGLGWAVVLWRPEAEAYAVLGQMQRRVALVAAASALLGALLALAVAGALTRPVLRLVEAARRLGQRDWVGAAQAGDERDDELGELQHALGQAARDLEEGERQAAREQQVRADLGRFLSRELVDKIVRGEHSLALGGRRQPVSVLFADVVAFTPLAEARPPEQTVALLNELFSLLTEIVFRHGGSVDKFIGDCLMAVWGAAEPQDDHAQRALDAAGDMIRFLETAGEGWKERYGVEVRLGIGVNSGPAIVGNIGSDKRMEFTVIGDVVNVAARLEAIAAPNQILLADATLQLVGDAFETRLLGERKLTGRAASTRVYELVA